MALDKEFNVETVPMEDGPFFSSADLTACASILCSFTAQVQEEDGVVAVAVGTEEAAPAAATTEEGEVQAEGEAKKTDAVDEPRQAGAELNKVDDAAGAGAGLAVEGAAGGNGNPKPPIVAEKPLKG